MRQVAKQGAQAPSFPAGHGNTPRCAVRASLALEVSTRQGTATPQRRTVRADLAHEASTVQLGTAMRTQQHTARAATAAGHGNTPEVPFAPPMLTWPALGFTSPKESHDCSAVLNKADMWPEVPCPASYVLSCVRLPHSTPFRKEYP